MWTFVESYATWIFSGLGTAILVGIVGLWRRRSSRGRLPDDAAAVVSAARVRVFQAPKGHQYNHEFYDYFTRRVRDARRSIWITGEGFEYQDKEGSAIADQFVQALRTALRNGVHIVRVQTRANPHPDWVDALAQLEREKKGKFDLFVLREAKVAQMSSVCVIDPEDATACVVEIMLSTQRLFGVSAADLAGTALFVESDLRLADDLCARIRSLTSPEVSIRCRTENEVRDLLGRSDYYFAYGSNMDEAQMRKRVPRAEKVGVGMIPDHALVFNRRGSFRLGGVASIAPMKGDRVYGVVWKVTALELNSLDEAEDPKAYFRRDVGVVLLDGQAITCHVYESIPEGNFAPDAQYLQLLVNAARSAELPPEYVTALSRLAS